MVDYEFTKKGLSSEKVDATADLSEESTSPESSNDSWEKKALGGVAVGAAAAAVVFLQTPANEALRVNIAFDVLNSTGDGNLAALSVVGSTAVIETAATTTIALGINYK